MLASLNCGCKQVLEETRVPEVPMTAVVEQDIPLCSVQKKYISICLYNVPWRNPMDSDQIVLLAATQETIAEAAPDRGMEVVAEDEDGALVCVWGSAGLVLVCHTCLYLTRIRALSHIHNASVHTFNAGLGLWIHLRTRS